MAVAEYDYIVVGAGTAGLSLATRLAQADKSVLVLEAGKDSSEAAEINVPGEQGQLTHFICLSFPEAFS